MERGHGAEFGDGRTAPASAATVEVMEIEGVGTVLTDAAGQVLYTSDEEAADPDVVCVDDCAEIWAPLIAAGTPPAVSGNISFALTARPDGSQQVTFEGRRLYRFTQEGPGQASGDGLSDSFGDQPFTWRAASVDAAATSSLRLPAAGFGRRHRHRARRLPRVLSDVGRPTTSATAARSRGDRRSERQPGLADSRPARRGRRLSSTSDGPLDGLRVVELTDDTGRFAGKVLAESGASVARIGRAVAGPGDARRRRRRPRRAARLVVRRRQALGRRRPRHGGRAGTPTGAWPSAPTS